MLYNLLFAIRLQYVLVLLLNIYYYATVQACNLLEKCKFNYSLNILIDNFNLKVLSPRHIAYTVTCSIVYCVLFRGRFTEY